MLISYIKDIFMKNSKCWQFSCCSNFDFFLFPPSPCKKSWPDKTIENYSEPPIKFPKSLQKPKKNFLISLKLWFLVRTFIFPTKTAQMLGQNNVAVLLENSENFRFPYGTIWTLPFLAKSLIESKSWTVLIKLKIF